MEVQEEAVREGGATGAQGWEEDEGVGIYGYLFLLLRIKSYLILYGAARKTMEVQRPVSCVCRRAITFCTQSIAFCTRQTF